MKVFTLLFALFAIAVAGPLVAGEAHFAGVTVMVPPQFSDPVRATPDPSSEVLAYSSASTPGVPRDVLQFTRYTIRSIPPDLSEADIAKGTTQYLTQMLQGIERARTSYVQTAPARIQLGGKTGSRASWTGKLNGAPTNGVMYCLILGTDIVLIHAFGGGTQPSDSLKQVYQAVEQLRVDAPMNRS